MLNIHLGAHTKRIMHGRPTYRVRNPLEGIPDWPPAATITAKYGAPGEIGPDGTTVKGVSVDLMLRLPGEEGSVPSPGEYRGPALGDLPRELVNG